MIERDTYLSLFRGPLPIPPLARYSPERLISTALRDATLTRAGQAYGVTPAQILGPRRFQPIARARQYACWLLRQHLTSDGRPRFSYPEIGLALGLHHTTVMHAEEAHQRRLAEAQGRAA